MNKKDMVTRLIWQGEVYYRVKDVAELRGVTVARLKRAIDKLNIPTRTIEGFGRMKWIEERYINEILIDEEIVYMRTEVKDYQYELDMQGKSVALASAFLGKEFDVEYVLDKTSETMDNFALANESKREQENKRKIKTMNEIFEEKGVANRFHTFKWLVGNEINELTVLVNGEGKIVNDEYLATGFIFEDETIGYIKDDIELDGGIYEENGELFKLDFGEPFECENMSSHLFNELVRGMRNEVAMWTNDYVDFKLDNGNYVGIKLDTFLDMLNEDIKVVA